MAGCGIRAGAEGQRVAPAASAGREALVDERRRLKWQLAAGDEELTLSEWIAVSLDLSAKYGNRKIRQALE